MPGSPMIPFPQTSPSRVYTRGLVPGIKRFDKNAISYPESPVSLASG